MKTGQFVKLDGRTFIVRRTVTGHLVVLERKFPPPGKLYAYVYDRPIFHDGNGRKPSLLARRVLAAAE